MVHNHIDKAAVLWERFKERLGHSEFQSIAFNLNFSHKTTQTMHGWKLLSLEMKLMQ
jgi:hypothetical protein